MIPSADPSDRDPIDLIAEDFANLCRRGEAPSVDEFVRRYPEHAEDLRVLLPTVGFLERGRADLARSAPPEAAGEIRFGEFRVLRELGRGGMGIVYEAAQESLGRRVAVKVLPRSSATDPRSRERFLREARAVAMLKHSHIVPIFGIGEWEGVPYFAMDLIDGVGLDRAMTSGPARTRERADWTARLGIQAADALDHAHRRGILHRDVKPANLLLEASGHLWLTDFGLAKLADDLSLTETGGLPGTLRYLAPECLDSDGDERSDLYSLGLTLYEVLLRRPAYTESNRIRLLQQVRDAEPAHPRSLDPDIPPDLETILLKATARDPDARYASASMLADDLRRFSDGRPILARRVGPGERLARLVKRNPLVSSLTMLIVLLASLTSVFVILYLDSPAVSLARPPIPPDFDREAGKEKFRGIGKDRRKSDDVRPPLFDEGRMGDGPDPRPNRRPFPPPPPDGPREGEYDGPRRRDGSPERSPPRRSPDGPVPKRPPPEDRRPPPDEGGDEFLGPPRRSDRGRPPGPIPK